MDLRSHMDNSGKLGCAVAAPSVSLSSLPSLTPGGLVLLLHQDICSAGSLAGFPAEGKRQVKYFLYLCSY